MADFVADAASGRKRSRTRARLILATAKVMSRTGYASLRIVDIVQAAGMSPGAFYVYFPDREAAAREVLSGLISHLYAAADFGLDDGAGGKTLVKRLTGLIVRLQANIPLVRALNQAVAVDPLVARQVDRALGAWLSAAPIPPGAEAAPFPQRTAFDLRWILLMGCARRCVERRLSRSEIDHLAGAIGRACMS